MRPIKTFEHGGMHWDLPETEPTKREVRQQEREDEKGMIPARFRNRGQEGLDAYISKMRKRGGSQFNLRDWAQELFQRKKGFHQKQEGRCEGGSCGQFG